MTIVYTIYADGVCIYDDVFALESMKVIAPKLILEDNSAGSLSITLPPVNVGYESIARMKSNISVCKDGEEIWAGRVLSENKDFWNNRVLYCEGELAFFNDTSQPPAEYPGISIREFLKNLLDIHNAKVPADRQFTIGAVTVNDIEFPTFRTNNDKTLSSLNALVEQYGGHFRVYKANGIRYLDYLKEYPDTCSQVIQFGSNLIDFTRNWDSTEFATVIVPLGNRLDDSPFEDLDAYLTVESVNGGSMYVKSDESFAEYGWIEKVVSWSNVSDPGVLLEKAKEYLKEIQFDSMEIELSALDLHYLHAEVEAVKLLDEIRVISRPHGLDKLFPVQKLEIPLDSPEQTQFTLGSMVRTSLTGANNQTSAAIMDKIEKLPKAHSLLKEAKDNATEIMHRATTGYITITQDEYGSETLYISNTRDYTAADKLWKWNMAGLGYSNDGGQTFGLAITMDGAIVADFITAGVLNGDIIRAGILQDVKKSNYWNLETGEFRLSASAQVGNSTVASKKDVKDLDESLDQDEVFNRLTNNGLAQGIYLEGGKLYINATYIATGVLKDRNSNVVFDLVNGTLTMKKGSIDIGNGNFKVDTDGNVTIKKGSINIGNGNFKVDTDGNVTIKKGSIDIGNGNYKVNTDGNVTIKKGSINIGNGNFEVDAQGNMTMKRGSIDIGNGTFRVGTDGQLTMKKGSINIGDNFIVDTQGNLTAKRGTFSGAINIGDNFIVDTSGNLTAKKGTFSGAIDIGGGNFKVDAQGNLTAKKGTFSGAIDIGSGNFKVDTSGNLTAKRGTFSGAINIGNGAFKVDEQGNLTATKGTFSGSLSGASGTFKGTVQASDFLDASGRSMMTKTTDSGTTGSVDRFKADYLDLHGIKITKKNTSTVTFEVDSNGAVTINGDITMGSGSTINWANVTNSNLQSNPAYSLASSANTAAANAKKTADDAATDAADAIAKANGIKVPTLPYYITNTEITSVRITSPTIIGASIYWGEGGVNGSLTRGWGNDGTHSTDVVQLYSPAGVVIAAGMGMRLEAGNGIWFNLSSSEIHIKDGSHYSTLAELING